MAHLCDDINDIITEVAIQSKLRQPAGLAGLGEFLHHHVALQPRYVVDEEHAVEMVDFVLQAGGEQAFGGQFLLLAVAVDVFHRDRSRRSTSA